MGQQNARQVSTLDLLFIAIVVALAAAAVASASWFSCESSEITSNGVERIERGHVFELQPGVLRVLLIAVPLALAGMHRLKRAGSSTLLWGAVGFHLLLGMATMFSMGPPLLLIGITLICYAVVTARRLGVPVITWRGVAAETAGFCGPILLYVALAF